MANPLTFAVALSRIAVVTCPQCGKRNIVERKPCRYRQCVRCHFQFPDPLADR